MNRITIIRDLPRGLVLVTDSREIHALKSHIGPCEFDFDSAFVGVRDGDYSEVWGFTGYIPLLSKFAYRVYPASAKGGAR